MLYKELLILVAMSSAGSQAVPQKCEWSDDMCKQCFLNCDRRHCDYGGTPYSCCEKCLTNDHLCAYGYCRDYRKICLSDQTVSTGPKESNCTCEGSWQTPNLCNKAIPPNVPCQCNDTATTTATPDQTASTTAPSDKEPDCKSKPNLSDQPTSNAAPPVWKNMSIGLWVVFVVSLLVNIGLVFGFSKETCRNRWKGLRKKYCPTKCSQETPASTPGTSSQTGPRSVESPVAEETTHFLTGGDGIQLMEDHDIQPVEEVGNPHKEKPGDWHQAKQVNPTKEEIPNDL